MVHWKTFHSASEVDDAMTASPAIIRPCPAVGRAAGLGQLGPAARAADRPRQVRADRSDQPGCAAITAPAEGVTADPDLKALAPDHNGITRQLVHHAAGLDPLQDQPLTPFHAPRPTTLACSERRFAARAVNPETLKGRRDTCIPRAC